MRRFGNTFSMSTLSLGLALGTLAMAGCESTPAERTEPAKPSVAAPKETPKEAAKPLAVNYQEIVRGNKVFVVGTEESAKRVNAGGNPISHIAEIGGGKTVYFENKPDGMEAALRAEYAKRHP